MDRRELEELSESFDNVWKNYQKLLEPKSAFPQFFDEQTHTMKVWGKVVKQKDFEKRCLSCPNFIKEEDSKREIRKGPTIQCKIIHARKCIRD